MQHQFGSMVLMADAYRQELLRDAARVRPIPAYPRPTSPGFRLMSPSLRYRLGTLLVRAGQRLQGVQAITRESLAPTSNGEVGAIA